MKSSTIIEAVHFAAQKHTGQQRKGAKGEPYINHPVHVAQIIHTIGGVSDFEVLAASILHDTLEDTNTSERELEEKFGKPILDLVKEVTDDKSLPKQKRKQLQIEHAPHLSVGATLIKIADKISNITDITTSPPKDWDTNRKQDYLNWGQAVVDNCKEVNRPLLDHFYSILEKAKIVLLEKSNAL
jgi:guanosine-3',5'-bis(diphosphate) 3'-pyrophosphohydrolase